jgi:hypothetical protein
MFQVLLCQDRDKPNQEEKQTQRRERENEKILTQSQNNRREEAVGDAPKTERKEIFHPSLLQRCDDERLTAAAATRQETTASHETLKNISSSKHGLSFDGMQLPCLSTLCDDP